MDGGRRAALEPHSTPDLLLLASRKQESEHLLGCGVLCRAPTKFFASDPPTSRWRLTRPFPPTCALPPRPARAGRDRIWHDDMEDFTWMMDKDSWRTAWPRGLSASRYIIAWHGIA